MPAFSISPRLMFRHVLPADADLSQCVDFSEKFC
jgi:hypothetical protein